MIIKGDWLSSASSQAVMQMLKDAGHAAYFVGGCVRNALLQHPVADIDISTDAVPEDVMQIAEVAGHRAVPTGIDHGTITVVVNEIAHEITTFRKDVTTDGRRATVAFSKEITDDALRRDFTMNALYADAQGTVIDPLGGLEDLNSRHVRFIENPATRIREDYLRILRFFRFHAWFGDPEAGLDADGLAACAELADGMDRLSKERVGAEMTKLLTAPDPAPSVAAMRTAGVLAHVSPGADDQLLAPLVHLEAQIVGDVPSSYLRRLAVLGGENATDALRLSKADARQLDLLREEMGTMTSAKELGYRHGAALGLDVLLLRGAMSNMPPSDQDLQDLAAGEEAVFPIKAADLVPDYQGPALGQKLSDLEATWIASGFALTARELLR